MALFYYVDLLFYIGYLSVLLIRVCLSYLTESCSEEAAHTAVRTLIDLGVSDSLYVCVCVSVCVHKELKLESGLKV